MNSKDFQGCFSRYISVNKKKELLYTDKKCTERYTINLHRSSNVYT